jgi:hypothetical protein
MGEKRYLRGQNWEWGPRDREELGKTWVRLKIEDI